MTKEFLKEHIRDLMLKIKQIRTKNPKDKRLESLYKELELYTEALGK